jgi:hypothetical protein
MLHLKSSFVVLGVSILILTSQGNADFIGGVDFGSAGPSNWGVLELGGSGAAGFGLSGGTVSVNGPNAGVYGTATQANIGIADGGRANFSGTTLIQGMLDEASTHASARSGASSNSSTTTAATNTRACVDCVAGNGVVRLRYRCEEANPLAIRNEGGT